METVISELDRIRALRPEAVADSIRELTGAAPPVDGMSAQWLHAKRMGYKLVGYFRRAEDDV